MTDHAAPATGIRVGVRFAKVSSAVQTTIDRFVFALIGRRARAEAPQHDRRLAPRVDIVHEKIVVELLPDLRGALSGGRRAEPRRFSMHDLSTTGCSFLCDDESLFRPRQVVRLRLVGEGLDVELQAKVIHALAQTGV